MYWIVTFTQNISFCFFVTIIWNGFVFENYAYTLAVFGIIFQSIVAGNFRIILNIVVFPLVFIFKISKLSVR